MVLKISTRCALLLLVPAIAWADFSGEVVGVLDGDTIEVMHRDKAERVRLHGIDCPEKGQAYGTRAKQAASALVFGKDVTVLTHGLDKYGRTIADVLLPDGSNVNQVLVKDGWCWWYRKYAPQDVTLEQLERSARAARYGLWVDPQPVPPWEYRKAARGKGYQIPSQFNRECSRFFGRDDRGIPPRPIHARPVVRGAAQPDRATGPLN